MIADNGSTFQVVVTNPVGSQTSHAATLTVNASGPPPTNAKVLTYHNDNMRTGLNPNETILTTSNVNSTAFGKLGSLQVTGLVDAEPLYVPNLTIGGAQHNVVFVVTEHDMAYAFDADTPGPALWQVSLIPSAETPSDDRGCGQVQPEIGITSTPVIDLSAGPNGTMFVVTMSKDSSNNYHQRLHAVDLTTGADRITPTEIQATYPGNGTGSSNGTQTFNRRLVRRALRAASRNGIIYTTWTSHCDAANYTSWVISYNESTLAQASVLNMTANGNTQGGREGGIWNAGDGPSVDASGNIYFLIGNGTFDTTLDGNGFPNTRDFGNGFVKLVGIRQHLVCGGLLRDGQSERRRCRVRILGGHRSRLGRRDAPSGFAGRPGQHAASRRRRGKRREHVHRQSRQHGQIRRERREHLPGT